ncbi:MAG: D-alanyl-D-alanine carboxypeptidase/D-alanyl-D-alanine endopeptidase [Polyangiales bacterium]
MGRPADGDSVALRAGQWRPGRWLALPMAALLVAAATVLLRVRPVDARGPQDSLARDLRALIAQSPWQGSMGVEVLQVKSGQRRFVHRATANLNPASNMKLLTTLAAIETLGPAHRFVTALLGQVDADGRMAHVVLRGDGDPSLALRDLQHMAFALAEQGVRRVAEVWLDARAFDGAVLPPAFEQQPHEVASFRAAVAAVSVAQNAYRLRVAPTAVGQPAKVVLDAPGYFVLDHQLQTVAQGPPRVIAVQKSRSDGRLELKLRGQIAVGTARMAFVRRVASPLHFAGFALVQALRRARIACPRVVRVAQASATDRTLVRHHSPPLTAQLRAAGKWSDNFTAEMLLKAIGARRDGKGSSAAGLKVLRARLQQLPHGVHGAALVNGSGLFVGNRISARHLTQSLRGALRRAKYRPDVLHHLAHAGVDGTLTGRLKSLPSGVHVRAKTGTLNDVVALSGVLETDEAGASLVFSILINGVKGRIGAARQLSDALVQRMAEALASDVDRGPGRR